MYQKPNQHGVYEAEYRINLSLLRLPAGPKGGRGVVIELAQISETMWAAGTTLDCGDFGFASPITHNPHSWSWQAALAKAILHIKERLFGKEGKVPAAIIAKCDELVNSLPMLRIEDFKITQEADDMAKKKTTEPAQELPAAQEPAAQTAEPVEDKLYFQKFKDGKSEALALLKPLTDHGKKMISDGIDSGFTFAELSFEHFERIKESDSVECETAPSEAENKVVQKLVEYEPLIKKKVSCSEYFDHSFTSDEIKQMAMEFAEASSRKTSYEEELKSHKKATEAKIAEVGATINRISTELARGKRSESVRCLWIFNDPTRNMKSLYRLDREPKELVRTDRMTASDKQLTLDDVAAQAKKTERTLEEKPITPITNEPYEGEMMTDSEVKEETGAIIEPESDATETDPEAEASAEASDECPI